MIARATQWVAPTVFRFIMAPIDSVCPNALPGWFYLDADVLVP